MDKVTVLTKAKLFQPEVFVDVFVSVEAAEKHLRKNVSPYLKKDGTDAYHVDDKGDITIYFARTVEVKK